MSRQGRLKKPATLQAECDAWNQKHPIGTAVKYYRLINPRAELKGVYTTRSEAQILGGHTAVIWLDGVSGCVALEAIELHEGTVE